MALASFFDDVPAITLRDPLAQLLGASDDGLITYHYVDAVRLAGHSCPTVAGAWLMARSGLRELYADDETPRRGGIHVYMPDAEDAGVTGVIAQILTLVTGAAAANGFHGLGGRKHRSGLLHYNSSGIANPCLQRADTGATVEVQYEPRVVGGSREQGELLGAVVHGTADTKQTERFGALWQDRVRRILIEHADDASVIRARFVANRSAPVAAG